MDLKFELLLIFLLTSNLYWLNYYVQQWLDESSAEWVDCGENGVCPVDLTKKAAKVIENLMYWGEPVVVVLSLFIQPFAILSPAFNNRITTAIR
ncbi:unnamed protein product, partial [Mesorhabditis belari]|uniref:Uncharacterized protein n=1 Tax=Mesorhabditis belari TaxID=2138241 RepID=A0AAF3J515_9BILA